MRSVSITQEQSEEVNKKMAELEDATAKFGVDGD
jgi:hypothetical protein